MLRRERSPSIHRPKPRSRCSARCLEGGRTCILGGSKVARQAEPATSQRVPTNGCEGFWFFFEEAIPARLARNLGAHVLTETMECRPDIGFGSYDRFFPNQDTLPQGGFGNLIALPLQKQARAADNSVFIDDQFQPYPDQWELLSAIRKLTRADVEAVVREAEGRGRILGVRLVLASEDEELPWMAPPSRRRSEPPLAGPLPAELELVMGDQIYIAKTNLPPGLRNRLVRLAAFQNPEFYRAQAMRLSTYDKPRIISCAEDFPQHTRGRGLVFIRDLLR